MNEKIVVPKTTYQRILQLAGILVLLGTLVYLAVSWNSIPDKIPAHFDAAGKVDRYGEKSEIIIVPMISVFLYALISFMEKKPGIWNTGVEVTEQNKDKVYLLLKEMIVTVKVLVTIDFSYATIVEINQRSLGIWFLPVFLLLLFGSIGFYIIKLFRIEK